MSFDEKAFQKWWKDFCANGNTTSFKENEIDWGFIPTCKKCARWGFEQAEKQKFGEALLEFDAATKARAERDVKLRENLKEQIGIEEKTISKVKGKNKYYCEGRLSAFKAALVLLKNEVKVRK